MNKNILTAACVGLLGLSACASTSYPPTPYDWVAKETHRRVIFNSRQSWHHRDYTVVPSGEERWGNCTTFAATAVDIMRKSGIRAATGECKSQWGPHAFAIITGTGLVVDSMHRQAVPFKEMGCAQ